MIKANKSIRKINSAIMSMGIIGMIVAAVGIILNFVLSDTLPIAKTTLLIIFLGVGLGLFIIAVILSITNAYKLKRFQLTLSEYEVVEENNALNKNAEFVESVNEAINPFEHLSDNKEVETNNTEINAENNPVIDELVVDKVVDTNDVVENAPVVENNIQQPNLVVNQPKPINSTPSLFNRNATSVNSTPSPSVNTPLKPIGLSPITSQPSFSNSSTPNPSVPNTPSPSPITPITKPIPNSISSSNSQFNRPIPTTSSPSPIGQTSLPTINRTPSVQIPNRNVAIPSSNSNNTNSASMFSSRRNPSN